MITDYDRRVLGAAEVEWVGFDSCPGSIAQMLLVGYLFLMLKFVLIGLSSINPVLVDCVYNLFVFKPMYPTVENTGQLLTPCHGSGNP